MNTGWIFYFKSAASRDLPLSVQRCQTTVATQTYNNLIIRVKVLATYSIINDFEILAPSTEGTSLKSKLIQFFIAACLEILSVPYGAAPAL